MTAAGIPAVQIEKGGTADPPEVMPHVAHDGVQGVVQRQHALRQMGDIDTLDEHDEVSPPPSASPPSFHPHRTKEPALASYLCVMSPVNLRCDQLLRQAMRACSRASVCV
jgi:hypothetical protein